MKTTTCHHGVANCPGPAGYDVDNFDSSGICTACEVDAMCSEPATEPVFNAHGLLVCDHAGCMRPAVTGGRCDWHQELTEG